MNSSCLNYGYGFGKRKKGKGESLFKTKSLFSSPQESLTKIKACLVDNKKHIRFGEWNSNDVSSNICRLLLSRTWFFWSPHVQNQNLQQRLRTTPISIMSTSYFCDVSDWSAEQTSLHHFEADDLLGQPLRKGLPPEEEQVVSEQI